MSICFTVLDNLQPKSSFPVATLMVGLNNFLISIAVPERFGICRAEKPF
jgi:hypothetical protein